MLHLRTYVGRFAKTNIIDIDIIPDQHGVVIRAVPNGDQTIGNGSYLVRPVSIHFPFVRRRH